MDRNSTLSERSLPPGYTVEWRPPEDAASKGMTPGYVAAGRGDGFAACIQIQFSAPRPCAQLKTRISDGSASASTSRTPSN